MGVVGGHQGDARLLVEGDQALEDLLLLGDAMVLQFQIVAVRAKQVPHGQGVGLGPGVVPGQQQPGELAGQAGGQGDDPLVVPGEQLPVHPGLAVKTLREAPADQGGEVSIPLLVPAQEDQVIGAVVHLMDPVEAGPGGHIDLAADDGLDALLLGCPVKIHRPVHDPVVGDGHGGLPQGLGPGHQAVNPAGAV